MFYQAGIKYACVQLNLIKEAQGSLLKNLAIGGSLGAGLGAVTDTGVGTGALLGAGAGGAWKHLGPRVLEKMKGSKHVQQGAQYIDELIGKIKGSIGGKGGKGGGLTPARHGPGGLETPSLYVGGSRVSSIPAGPGTAPAAAAPAAAAPAAAAPAAAAAAPASGKMPSVADFITKAPKSVSDQYGTELIINSTKFNQNPQLFREWLASKNIDLRALGF